MVDITKLQDKARWVRQTVLKMAVRADSGHVTTAMSQCEVLVALYYGGILRYDPSNPHWEGRDQFILSKGQGGLGLYPILADVGFFPLEKLDNFLGVGSTLGVHAEPHTPGVELLTGSLGHGLPIATGKCLALKNEGKDNLVYVMVGDGELQEGSNWEAMMFASHHKLSNLIVIVDRNGQYTLGRTDGDTVRDGPKLEPLASKFHAFGFTVIEVDGHSLEDLLETLEDAKDRSAKSTRPLCIIANTKKGYGLPIADERNWHYKVPRGEILDKCWDALEVPKEERPVQSDAHRAHDLGMRERFFEVLYQYFKNDKDMVMVVADNGSVVLDRFATDFPGQYVQVGIAEQEMVGVACGLATQGKKVYCYAIAPFVTTRVHEFVKLDVCAMGEHGEGLPICMVGVGASFAYSQMGPTHSNVEDVSIMRALPNMQVFCPSDGVTAEYLGHVSAKLRSPHYIRLDRGGLPDIHQCDKLSPSGIVRIREGTSFGLCIVATGVMIHRALEVAERLGSEVRVLDIFSLKPLDTRMMLKEIEDSWGVVTLEEHLLNGGLGGIVSEVFADHCIKTPLLRIGVDDKFTFVLGGRGEAQKLHGLDLESVVKKISEWERKVSLT